MNTSWGEIPGIAPDDFVASDEPYVFFVQPTVILDGLLYSAELDDSGDIQLTEIDHAAVNFEFASRGYRRGRYHVNVVRLDKLDDYMRTCEEHHKKIFDALLLSCSLH